VIFHAASAEENAMLASEGSLRLRAAGLAAPRRQSRPAGARPEARSGWLARLLRRREPTTYHRCLAIHIHYAGPRSALS
jgi:hypothetical protein